MKPNIGTILKISDNSGVKKIKNINIHNKNKKVLIGNLSISVIKKGSNIKKNIKKSDIMPALIISTKKYFFNINKGTVFNNNSAVLLRDSDNRLVGTKIIGFLSSAIKNKIYKLKINLKKAKFI